MKTILLSLLLLAGAIAVVDAQSYRKAIFYHHSTGGCFYDRQNLYDNSTPSSVPTVPKEVAKYNTAHGFSVNTGVSMSEQWMPSDPTGNNWSDWAATFAGGMSYSTPVIIIKTCYLQQQSMHSSGDIETLKGYYRALVREMAKHPANFFVIWNNMPAPTDGLSDRAVWSAQFSVWCKDVLAKGNDSFGVFPANVYVFDVFRKLADPVTGYCDPKYGNPGDDHPSSASVTLVTPQFVKEVFDAAIAYEGGPLAITLGSFGVTLDKNVATISFTTLTETNVYRYYIERKNSAATQWDTVAIFDPKGPSTYSAKETLKGSGAWQYRLNETDLSNAVTYFGATAGLKDTAAFAAMSATSPAAMPGAVLLTQNYPNPFNPSTTLGYRLQYQSHVKLSIYDILGREVAVLVNTLQSSGDYEIHFDASRLSSGVYAYRIQVTTNSNQYADTKRFVVAK